MVVIEREEKETIDVRVVRSDCLWEGKSAELSDWWAERSATVKHREQGALLQSSCSRDVSCVLLCGVFMSLENENKTPDVMDRPAIWKWNVVLWLKFPHSSSYWNIGKWYLRKFCTNSCDIFDDIFDLIYKTKSGKRFWCGVIYLSIQNLCKLEYIGNEIAWMRKTLVAGDCSQDDAEIPWWTAAYNLHVMWPDKQDFDNGRSEQ